MPLPCHGLSLPPHPSRIINSLKQDTANNDIADRAAPATPHPTDMHLQSSPTTSPSITPAEHSRRNNPSKKPCPSGYTHAAHDTAISNVSPPSRAGLQSKIKKHPAMQRCRRYAIDAVWPKSRQSRCSVHESAAAVPQRPL